MKKTLFICLLLGMSLSLHYSEVFAANRLPLRVQIVLLKVAPLLEKQQYSQAIKLLDAFKNKADDPADPVYNHTEIHFVLGNCHLFMEQLQQARASFLLVVTKNPKHVGAWQNLAKTEYDLGHYNQASKAFFKTYLLTNRTKAKYLYYSAVTLLLDEQCLASLKYFETLLATHPQAVTLQWKENLIYALIQAKKPEKALPYMIELCHGFTGKKKQKWQEILLQHYMALDMREEALNLAQTLTRQAPTVALWWKGLTHIQLQYEQYTKALAAMTIYSFLTPLTSKEEKLLGDLYMQQGIPLKAAKYFEHNANKKPNRQTILQLIRAYRSLGRNELALQKLNSFMQDHQDPKLEMKQGEILYDMDHYSEAATTFERTARGKGKHSAKAFLMAGYSYWQLGNYDKARAAFSQTTEMQQGFVKEAATALKQLTRASINNPEQ